jgi:hypothetical protein
MFNSPALDIAIGLVFIFLLYSLLATSIQEAVATLFSMRASMLRKCIVENMLADTLNLSKTERLDNAVKNFFKALLTWLHLITNEHTKTLGDKFYDHPLIKNYGESKMFPLPSYIPQDNFSAVLIDIMLKDFDDNLTGLAQIKIELGEAQGDIESVKNELAQLSTPYKVRELLRFHLQCYADNPAYGYYLECETCRILEMHLRNSLYDLTAFCHKLEGWFDDSMRRVSGWYKRQTQFVLFIMGLIMAFMFNVDVIAIAGRLSTDKDAREKIVQLAIKAADSYKDDPRVQQIKTEMKNAGTEEQVKQLADIKKEYDNHLEKAKLVLNGDIAESNNLLSVGWNDYGKNDANYLKYVQNEPHRLKTLDFRDICELSEKVDAAKVKSASGQLTEKFNIDRLTIMNNPLPQDPIKAKTESVLRDKKMTKLTMEYIRQNDSIQNAAFYSTLTKERPVASKLRYVLYLLTFKKILGFVILAFGIGLGAPFWFDLLNKLVNIRGTGKRETTAPAIPFGGTPQQLPTIINNNQKTGAEAVG